MSKPVSFGQNLLVAIASGALGLALASAALFLLHLSDVDVGVLMAAYFSAAAFGEHQYERYLRGRV